MSCLSRLLQGSGCVAAASARPAAAAPAPAARCCAPARAPAGPRVAGTRHVLGALVLLRAQCASADGSSSSGRVDGTPSSSSSSSVSSSTRWHRDVRTRAAADGGAASGTSTILTLPTILTLGRVAAVPALVAAWFWASPHATAVVTGLFIAASITDWLDGYLARKMNLSSKFGAFLDPVADKLMVAAALILLCTQPLAAGSLAGNAWVVPACTLVIIGREITMSALREWAATLGPSARDAVAVNAWGKWKTASQMVALTALLMTRDGIPAAAAGAELQLLNLAAVAGPPALAIAAYLSAHSLALYLRGLWKFMV